MGMRVRGKATARPDKVGGPTLDASGGRGGSPTVTWKSALAVPKSKISRAPFFPGCAAIGRRHRCRGAAKCRSISHQALQFAAPARISCATCIIPKARPHELRSGDFP